MSRARLIVDLFLSALAREVVSDSRRIPQTRRIPFLSALAREVVSDGTIHPALPPVTWFLSALAREVVSDGELSGIAFGEVSIRFGAGGRFRPERIRAALDDSPEVSIRFGAGGRFRPGPDAQAGPDVSIRFGAGGRFRLDHELVERPAVLPRFYPLWRGRSFPTWTRWTSSLVPGFYPLWRGRSFPTPALRVVG